LSIIEKIKNNNIVKTILGVIIFILCLPLFNILLESIFDLGRGLGTYARLIG